jgi:hypothetical protein
MPLLDLVEDYALRSHSTTSLPRRCQFASKVCEVAGSGVKPLSQRRVVWSPEGGHLPNQFALARDGTD